MEEYDVNGVKTKVGDKVIFTDPWHRKHEATITKIEPKNGSHHATLEMDKEELAKLIDDKDANVAKFFHDRWFNEFRDVPHHKEGAPYSWDHKE
jgi:hypothetical protein